MRLFWTIAGRARGRLLVIALSALAGVTVTLALPSVLGNAVDTIVAGHDSSFWVRLAGLLVLVGICTSLIDAYVGTAAVAATTAWLRNLLVRHVLALPPQTAARFDTGDLVSRVSANTVDAAQAGPGLVTAVAAMVPPLGSLVLLAFIDVPIALAFLFGVGLVALVLQAFARHTSSVVGEYQETQGRIAARLSESLTGIRTIAAAGTASLERQRLLEPLESLHAQGVRTWRIFGRSVAQAAVVGPLVLVAVLIVGGFSLAAGRITPGELFAASQYAVLGAGLGGLTGVFGELARSRAATRRASEILSASPLVYGTRPLPPGSPHAGALEFRSVSVHRVPSSCPPSSLELPTEFPRVAHPVPPNVPSADENGPILNSVSITIPARAAVAIVGRSGAGKSVLAAAAARLLDPDEGTVLLDGVPLPELTHDTLRCAVGCAFERPVLVGETVGDAIQLGHQCLVRRRECHRTSHGRAGDMNGSTKVVAQEVVARAAHAHEFVTRLPSSYDTRLSEAPMSGGEAQRLGLARALHAERVLVLDDATSSLDMVTEMLISRALTSDDRRRTRMIVTHRAATAARADLVVWLEAGRLAGFAPHSELWTQPRYREVFG